MISDSTLNGWKTQRGAFFGRLLLEDIDGVEWKVAEAFGYVSLAGDCILVPAGFETDLASVPAIGRWLFPRSGRYNEAAVCHDWMYWTHFSGDRMKCDRLFREMMAYLGVGRIERNVMFMAVRVGGWGVWNRHVISGRIPSE